MTDGKLPEPAPDWAIFLDFDGTLVELANQPDEATPAPEVPELLQRLGGALGGAVAIVTGRTLASLEAQLGPLDLPMAGIHGIERRRADGQIERAVAGGPGFDAARRQVAEFVAAHPGTHYEDKGCALTLHYRGMPELADAVAALLEGERQRLGEGFHIQQGHDVLELKPRGNDKGTVVARFLDEPPFRGRRPVFIGDDITDEDAFALVRNRDGHAIRVGDHGDSYATATLPTVREVLAWLERTATTLERTPRAGDTASSSD